MHYHCEIIIPPTDDIESAVASIMKPFCEGEEESSHAFGDWYVIGGRFAGTKLMAKYDQAKLQEFQDWLQAEHVTVSGLQCGKQELSPSSQAGKVDAKWNEMFPSETWHKCPMFAHSNDQYGRDGRGTIDGDVCPLPDALTVKPSRVIFAAPSYSSETREYTGPLEAVFMLCDSQWNGCNHMPVRWDETVGGALTDFRKKLENYREEFRHLFEPTDNWLAITVDYHS